MLERLGLVILVRDPAREVEALRRQFAARGEDCVYFEFRPPNAVTLGLSCPTIPVFAWEFESLPDEDWRDDPRDVWAYVLRATGRAITHSAHAARITRKAVGEDYKVTAIPAPVWDRHARFAGTVRKAAPLAVPKLVIDTRGLDLTPWTPIVRRAGNTAPLPEMSVVAGEKPAVLLDGIVYTTVFNPIDSRKNWSDMLAAFIWALRDHADATLVLKLTHAAPAPFVDAMLAEMAKHTPFACRLLVLGGYLEDEAYEALVQTTNFVVNASHGEGQCLPLMEFMSAGRPAIAPDHTGMADYVTRDNAFIVHSSLEPCGWPHDARMVYRTLRHRIDFASLVAAYAESYAVAAGDPARYARMSRAASETMGAHCSEARVETLLRAMLDMPSQAAAE